MLPGPPKDEPDGHGQADDGEQGPKQQQINPDIALTRAEYPCVHEVFVWRIEKPCHRGNAGALGAAGSPKQREAASQCKGEESWGQHRYSLSISRA